MTEVISMPLTSSGTVNSMIDSSESAPPLESNASNHEEDMMEIMEVEPEMPDVGHLEDSEAEEDQFPGYGAEDEANIFPNIEYKSFTLFKQVQELESEHAATIAELFSQLEVPVQVPRHALRTRGGSDIYIEQMIIGKGENPKTYITGIEKLPKSDPRRKQFSEGDGGLTVGDEMLPRRNPKNSTITSLWADKCPFSQAELVLLRRPLLLGWIRDVILKSPDGMEAGQVSYISPDGTMVRSYKDLALALSNYTGGNLSRANFSFTARQIGGSPNEIVTKPHASSKFNRASIEAGMMDMGAFHHVSPARKRRRPGMGESSLANALNMANQYGMELGDMPNIPAKRRRRRGGLPIKNTLIEKMQVNDSEGGLFGISALSEIFAGMEKADAERELEEYNHMMSLMAAQENVLGALDPSGVACTVTGDGEMVPRDEILPCSIRCPGMTGKIPGLQCTRCLCLYHAECLGFPEDVDSTNFLCSNCEGNDSPVSSPNTSPSKDAMYEFMNKMLELKKPYTSPPALRSFPGLGKNVSIKKLQVDPKGGVIPPMSHSSRNRSRIPPIPQLTSHNLTITPLLPTHRGQIPRVPTLSPINGPRNSGTIPVFKRGRGGRQSTLIDNIQVNPQRQGNLSKHPFSNLSANSCPRKSLYPVPNFGASFGVVKQPTSNIFRNYPQSVVSVGQKKFIVIPKGPPPNAMKMFEKSPKKRFEEFGKESAVLTQVFKYLTVTDLLNVSSVNSVWRKEAADTKLWKVLRLKNTRIYDGEAFGEFVSRRSTETIDFRKILGSVDWPQLFMKLSSAPSLQTLILGSKAEELADIAKEHCPNLEVLGSPVDNP